MAESVRIEGLQQLSQTLMKLPARLEKNVILGALRAAGQVIRREAMARVPVLQKPDPRRRAGTVRKNITVRRARGRLAVYVGVASISKKANAAFKAGGGQKGANNPDDPYYWTWIEFGTKFQPARPFLRPAFEAKKYEALRKFDEYMKKRLVKEAQKLARENGMRRAA
jgi:HK97 gp10 family phage protein